MPPITKVIKRGGNFHFLGGSDCFIDSITISGAVTKDAFQSNDQATEGKVDAPNAVFLRHC